MKNLEILKIKMKISLLQDSNQKEQTFKCNLLYLLKLKKNLHYSIIK